MRACEVCGTEIDVKRRADARTCGATCKKRRQRATKTAARRIPHRMKVSAQWVTHTTGKVPTQTNGKAASVADPSTWVKYSNVAQLPRVGYVLNGAISVVDLDDCLDEAGAVSPVAAKLLSMLESDTYVEVSMSGKGLHIFGYGTLSKGKVTTIDDQKVEAYSRGRYIAVTGEHYGTPVTTLSNIQPLLDYITQVG